MGEIILLGISIVISYFIAKTFGSKRTIGFWGSFFFCVFLSPIIGFAITMLSKKNNPLL